MSDNKIIKKGGENMTNKEINKEMDNLRELLGMELFKKALPSLKSLCYVAQNDIKQVFEVE